MPYEVGKTYKMSVLFVDAKGRYLNIQSPSSDKSVYKVDVQGKLAKGARTLSGKSVEVVCVSEEEKSTPKFALASQYFISSPEGQRGLQLDIHEGLHVEFKSSIVYSAANRQIDGDQPRLIAKELAAFMNTEGGDLYCGVDDDGFVVGIANDLKQLSNVEIDAGNGRTDKGWKYKGTLDGFSQKIQNIVRFYLGDVASTLLDDPEFIEDKGSGLTYVRIHANPSFDEFVYLGVGEKVFYRSGTSSVLLEGRAREQYARKRFNVSREPPVPQAERLESRGISAEAKQISSESKVCSATSTCDSVESSKEMSIPNVGAEKVKELGSGMSVIDAADNGSPDWGDVASLLAQNIRTCLKLDFQEFEFGECVLLHWGDPMPKDLSLHGEWQHAVALRIKSPDRKRIMDEIQKFNDAPVRPRVCGEFAVWQFPEPPAQIPQSSHQISQTVFLPHWLTRYIYDEKRLTYCTDCEAVQYNLSADRDFSFQYLATYFPRTFAEVTAIFDYVFASNQAVIGRLGDAVSILDVGCGSGAAAIALLWSLKKAGMTRIRKVVVTGLDGNENFIDRFREMTPTVRERWPSVDVSIDVQLVSQIEKALAECPERHYDFVVSSKFVQELNSDDAFKQILSAGLEKVVEGGTLLFLENYRRGRTEYNCNLAKNIRNAHVEFAPMKEFDIRQIPENTCVCETVGFQLLTNVHTIQKENK